jgi:hypothetical protein
MSSLLFFSLIYVVLFQDESDVDGLTHKPPDILVTNSMSPFCAFFLFFLNLCRVAWGWARSDQIGAGGSRIFFPNRKQTLYLRFCACLILLAFPQSGLIHLRSDVGSLFICSFCCSFIQIQPQSYLCILIYLPLLRGSMVLARRFFFHVDPLVMTSMVTGFDLEGWCLLWLLLLHFYTLSLSLLYLLFSFTLQNSF